MPKVKGAPGKKVCHKCEKLCGVRCKVCPHCENNFTPKDKDIVGVGGQPAKQSRKSGTLRFPDEYQSYRILTTTYVPAGEAPIKLPDKATEEDVIQWAYEMRCRFLQTHYTFLLNHALAYYVRYTHDMFSEEYKRICEIIDKIPDLQIIEPEVLDGA
jgi:hypothetical protein